VNTIFFFVTYMFGLNALVVVTLPLDQQMIVSPSTYNKTHTVID